MSATDNDAELVQRARNGDGDAFGELVERYQKLLTSVAFGILGEDGKTEDAVQDAFISAWQNLRTYRGEANFRNWLCRILVNKAYSVHRWGRLRRWMSLDGASETESALVSRLVDESLEADPERRRLAEEKAKAVQKAVADLPIKQRTAVMLRSNGLDVAAVAEAMSVAEGTVKAHLFQAREKLQKALGES
ncbi:MAG: RNA polymerase sigma factor [Proteobacteria bacterium]|nr:RNA polymerase sigma factor [Pseudomonadota bacterium]